MCLVQPPEDAKAQNMTVPNAKRRRVSSSAPLQRKPAAAALPETRRIQHERVVMPASIDHVPFLNPILNDMQAVLDHCNPF